MSYDEYDALRDEYESRLYEEFYTEYRNSSQFYEDMDAAIAENIDEVIGTAIEERLKAYYLNNQLVAQPSSTLFSQARELFGLKHYSPAQVFAGAATEVAFKQMLFFPIVFCLVHNDTVATMIVEIFAK